MKAVVQRAGFASVTVNGKMHTSIRGGLVVFLGVSKTDNISNAEKMAKKLIGLRIFEDEKGLMNLSVKDTGGELLVISQFTICADSEKSGNRPSFSGAMESVRANELFDYAVNKMKEFYDPDKVKTGIFAEMMDVALINKGPVTIILDK